MGWVCGAGWASSEVSEDGRRVEDWMDIEGRWVVSEDSFLIAFDCVWWKNVQYFSSRDLMVCIFVLRMEPGTEMNGGCSFVQVNLAKAPFLLHNPNCDLLTPQSNNVSSATISWARL